MMSPGKNNPEQKNDESSEISSLTTSLYSNNNNNDLKSTTITNTGESDAEKSEYTPPIYKVQELTTAKKPDKAPTGSRPKNNLEKQPDKKSKNKGKGIS